jgi:transcriptional regulator with XRE-family HTH domain
VKRQLKSNYYLPIVDLGANILTFRKKNSMSAEKLAQLVGVSKQMMYQYEQGKSIPRKEILAKIADTFGLTVSQLYGNPESVPIAASTDSIHTVPFFDAVAVGGAALLADQTAINEPTEMIHPGTWFRTAKGALRIYGHSMFPKYPAGCIVAFKEADKDVIIWGEDYVIELEDRRIIKRLERHDDRSVVSAVSYNRSEDYVYAPIEIPKSKIKRLFMVLGKVELEASI